LTVVRGQKARSAVLAETTRVSIDPAQEAFFEGDGWPGQARPWRSLPQTMTVFAPFARLIVIGFGLNPV